LRQNRNFWLYALGRLVSLVGTGIQDVAIPLFILDLTGSGTIMGSFMIVTMVPRLVLYPLGGVVGDRVSRKWIMVWTDYGRGLVILLLAILAYRGDLTVSGLFIAQFTVSLMSALFGPATEAMLPDIVEDDELTRATSTMGGINGVSMIVGPALGGVIYGLGGIELAFLLNGVSFIASGFSEMFISYHQVTRRFESARAVISDLREGFGFVRNTRAIMVLIAFALLVNAFSHPLFAVGIPYILRVVIGFSPREFGIVQASFMGGLVLGNIIIATFLAKRNVQDMLNRGLLAAMVMMFVTVALFFPISLETLGYASLTMLVALVVTFLLTGIFEAFINTPINVEMQRLAPTEYRARVFAVLGVGTQGVVPIGFGVMGLALDIFPAHLIALGVTVASATIVVVFVVKYSKIVSSGLTNQAG